MFFLRVFRNYFLFAFITNISCFAYNTSLYGGSGFKIKITGFPHFVFSSLLRAQTMSLFVGSVIWQLETEEFLLLHAS